MFSNALNSSALPNGSSKNIVDCSPIWPLKRTCGSMMNSHSRRFETVGEHVPFVDFQDDAEMPHRHLIAVDQAGRVTFMSAAPTWSATI